MLAEVLNLIKPKAEWNILDGTLIWLDEEQTEPTESEIADGKKLLKKTKEETLFRQKRNKLLAECDILINKALDKGEDVAKLREYRQALRDATDDWQMPE